MTDRLRTIVASHWFSGDVLTVIVANAVALGLETYAWDRRPLGRHPQPRQRRLPGDLRRRAADPDRRLRLAARGTSSATAGTSSTSSSIGVAFVPGVSESSTLLRLARLARVVRIVRLFPDLRVLLAGVWRSIPPLFAIGLATGMLLFVYGMVGWALFADELPEQWGNIGRAMLTLFVMLTLENFPTYMDAGMEVHPWSWVYFVSFILIAAFVVINVLIGIVLNSMEEAREAERARRCGAARGRAERGRPRRERTRRRADRDPPRRPRRARGRAVRSGAPPAPPSSGTSPRPPSSIRSHASARAPCRRRRRRGPARGRARAARALRARLRRRLPRAPPRRRGRASRSWPSRGRPSRSSSRRRCWPAAPAATLLDDARRLHPHAKRALLIDWGDWGDATGRRDLRRDRARGASTTTCSGRRPAGRAFHQAISGFLLEWAESQPHRRRTPSASSASRGRAGPSSCASVLGAARCRTRSRSPIRPRARRWSSGGRRASRAPPRRLPDGTVLTDPTNASSPTPPGRRSPRRTMRVRPRHRRRGTGRALRRGVRRVGGLQHAGRRRGRDRRPGDVERADPQLPRLPPGRQRPPPGAARLRAGVGLRRQLRLHADASPTLRRDGDGLVVRLSDGSARVRARAVAPRHGRDLPAARHPRARGAERRRRLLRRPGLRGAGAWRAATSTSSAARTPPGRRRCTSRATPRR